MITKKLLAKLSDVDSNAWNTNLCLTFQPLDGSPSLTKVVVNPATEAAVCRALQLNSIEDVDSAVGKLVQIVVMDDAIAYVNEVDQKTHKLVWHGVTKREPTIQERIERLTPSRKDLVVALVAELEVTK